MSAVVAKRVSTIIWRAVHAGERSTASGSTRCTARSRMNPAVEISRPPSLSSAPRPWVVAHRSHHLHPALLQFLLGRGPLGKAQSGDVGLDTEQVALGPQQATGVLEDRAEGGPVVYQHVADEHPAVLTLSLVRRGRYPLNRLHECSPDRYWAVEEHVVRRVIYPV
jgi:hypothetical protein